MVNPKSPVPVKPASPARLSIAKSRPEPPAARTCATCRYYRETDPEGGQCRRFPPVPMNRPTKTMPSQDVANHRLIESATVSAFPGVRKADIWCGEWKKP